MAKTAGFALVELMIVVAVIAVLATIAVPQFNNDRERSRVTQVVASSGAMRAALASYAVCRQGHTYPSTATITDFDSLRLVVNAPGGMLSTSAIFTVKHYDLYHSPVVTLRRGYLAGWKCISVYCRSGAPWWKVGLPKWY